MGDIQRAVVELRPDGVSWAITSAEKRELDHICCCSPAKAMCGAFVAGQDVKFGGPEKATRPCQECFNRAADGEPCGEPDCPGGEE